jgi:hypothetical protein
MAASARLLSTHAKDKATARMFLDVADNAKKIAKAQTSLRVSATNLPSYSDEWKRWVFQNIDDTVFDATHIGGAEVSLKSILEDALEMGDTSVTKAVNDAITGLEAAGRGRSPQVAGRKALEHLFEARKAVVGSAHMQKTGWAGKIDTSISKLTTNDVLIKQQLGDIDNFVKGLGEYADLMKQVDTKDFSGGALAAKEAGAWLKQMDTSAQSLGFRPKVLNALRKDAEVMSNLDIIEGFDVMSNANAAARHILYEEGANVGTMLKVPKGVEEALTSGDSILDMQVSALSDFKKDTGAALRYLWAAGGTRGAVSFSGVLGYRSMNAEAKKEHFVEAREIVLAGASSPERMMASIAESAGQLAAVDMQLAASYSLTLATAQGYLLQQMPRSSDPLIGPEDYSMQEVDSYLETIGALESPASVLASAKDGSVSVEAVDAIRTVYPELYTDMILDIVEFMQTRDWDKLNEAQRLGLDTFTGGALGVLQTYGPMPGPLFAQTPMQQQALGKNTQQSSPQMAHQQSQMNSTGGQKVSGL